jgi:hypothetical protein
MGGRGGEARKIELNIKDDCSRDSLHYSPSLIFPSFPPSAPFLATCLGKGVSQDHQAPRFLHADLHLHHSHLRDGSGRRGKAEREEKGSMSGGNRVRLPSARAREVDIEYPKNAKGRQEERREGGKKGWREDSK